jgi:formiminotetrahydrofolate cyclodeaminase
MADSFWSSTLADFRDRIASASPTPSGGSVAAVSAAFALGLVVMVLEITRKGAVTEDTEDAEQAAALDPLLAAARPLLDRLGAHADRDAAAYASFMAASALSKGSDEEKAVRRRRMQEALTAATESPLAAARDIAAALALAVQAADRCKKPILSDLATGVDLLAASLTAVLRNVDVNLQGLSDTVYQERLREERAALAAAGAQHAAAALATIDARTRPLEEKLP